MKEVLNKFKSNIIIKLEGIAKDSYFESYENGEGDYNGCYGIEYLDKDFIVKENEFTREHLTNLVVGHLNKELTSNLITKDWLCIQGDYITLSTYEIDGDQCTKVITDISEQEEKGYQVYSCYYKFELYINGQKLTRDDMISLLDIEN